MYKLYPYMVIFCVTSIYAMDPNRSISNTDSLKRAALPTLSAQVEHFHDLLTRHVTTHGNLENFHMQDSQDGLFEDYADSVLQALNPNTISGHYQARSTIVKLAQILPELKRGEQLLEEYCGPLYTALTKIYPEWEHDAFHMPVASTFKDCHFHPNLDCCVGYVKQPDGLYQLHVCESATGLPLWISPTKSEDKHAYSISDNILYYTSDAKSLLKLDLKTYRLSEVQTNTSEDIHKIHALDNGSCYVLHERSASLFDLITKRKKTIKLPEDAYRHKAFFADNCLIVPTPTDFVIFNCDGTSTHIPHYCNPSVLASPEAVATQHILAYQHTSESGKRNLRFINHTSSKEMWNYPLARNAIKIMFSPTRDKLFVLTDNSLMAFNTMSHEDLERHDLPRLSWQTQLEPSEINKLHITNNGKIYGYSTHKGTFYTFDYVSGQRTRVHKIRPSCTYDIVGDCRMDDNEMLYVKQ